MTETPCHPKDMAQKSWMSWVLLLALLWICLVCVDKGEGSHPKIKNCQTSSKEWTIVGDKFKGTIHEPSNYTNATNNVCIVFLHKVTQTAQKKTCNEDWPELEVRDNGSHLLYLSKWKRYLCLRIMYGRQCNQHFRREGERGFNKTITGNCSVVQLKTKQLKTKQLKTNEARRTATHNDEYCNTMDFQATYMKNKSIINIAQSTENCIIFEIAVNKTEKQCEQGHSQTGAGWGINTNDFKKCVNLLNNRTAETQKAEEAVDTVLTSLNKCTIVGDKFNGRIHGPCYYTNATNDVCIVFLHKVTQIAQKKTCHGDWPQLEVRGDGSHLLYLSKWTQNLCLRIMYGRQCNQHFRREQKCGFNKTITGNCSVVQLKTNAACRTATYENCNTMDFQATYMKNKYIIYSTRSAQSCIIFEIPVNKTEKQSEQGHSQTGAGWGINTNDFKKCVNLLNNRTAETQKAEEAVDKVLTSLNKCTIVGDKFNGRIHGPCYYTNATNDVCIVFLHKVTQIAQKKTCHGDWPHLEVRGDGSHLLYLSKSIQNLCLRIMYGRQCNQHFRREETRGFNKTITGNCSVVQLKTNEACGTATYNDEYCNAMAFQAICRKYIVNITQSTENCINCDNPVKKAEVQIKMQKLQTEEGRGIDPGKATDLMKSMASLVSTLSESTAEVSAGDGVTGIIVMQRAEEAADIEEVSFAFSTPNSTINIVESRERLLHFQRSVTVSKEAFEKAFNLSNGTAFAAVFQFINLAKDERNSSVLGNVVFAIEMGEMIRNLTDKIVISFRNVTEEGNASCQSWNGQGNLPTWTDDGCQTIRDGDNITCQCSHLTFFAVLLSPPDITISSSDLSTLTTITNVGCGLSMFFLSIALFMHFLLRRAKASVATKILIQLISALFLLNLTFLTNNWVAMMKNSVGCKIMAALMHYFMLATFTWFAVEAFHLCLQLYMAGKITIRHYILKVSIISWALPSVVVIVLLITAKYGEQIIITDDTNVTMCWILDNDVHYIVNIGYYALVFLFTFTTFVFILHWLYCRSITKARSPQISQNGKSIVAILGLCCMLGITWGFAFFAYGALRVPSYYIFTILNSFQGFFLFIYYYSQSKETQDGGDKNLSSTSSAPTMKTTVEQENPYSDQQTKT